MKKKQEPASISEDSLMQQNSDIPRELLELKAVNRIKWTLLVDLSRKLQASSASIKAAVTSLLDREIFWDPNTQFEFLTGINEGVDSASSLILLLSLLSRAETGSLALKRDPHELQEILSIVQEHFSKNYPKLALKVKFPSEGKVVQVDYDYLVIVLRILFEVLDMVAVEQISVQATAFENPENWNLDITSENSMIIPLVAQVIAGISEQAIRPKHVSPEVVLRMVVIQQISDLNGIQVQVHEREDGEAVLRLIIPVSANGNN